jgi:putative ABC transport system permease protein
MTLETLLQDLRYGVRSLRRSPAFTAAAALTLALGVGANSAIFALVDATLLRPLSFPEPDRLVMLWESSKTGDRAGVAPLNMIDWDARNQSFGRIAGFVPGVGGMVMNGANGIAETVSRQWVTAGFFDVLGVKPIAGRMFLADDDRLRANAVVLTEAFWRSRFNADPGIVGRDIRLDGAQYTIVGVAPNEAQILGRTSIWALMPISGAPPRARTMWVLRAIGRMKAGATVDMAAADMRIVADTLAREFPNTNAGRGVAIQSLHEALIGSDLRRTSMLFLGVVAFVLLICCANVANLLLARATVRSRELSIRSALGAARRRIMRQLFTESLMLSIVGGALGMVIGAFIVRIAPAIIPDDLLPTAVTLSFDGRVGVFCAVTTLLVGVLFGVIPALHATGSGLMPAIGSDTRSTPGYATRLREWLVASEVAAAVLLLVGAGLLLRCLLALDRVDPGYRATGVLTMVVDPLGSQYPNPPSLLRFFDDVERQVRAVPGVRNAAWTTTVPLGSSDLGPSTFEIVGDATLDDSKRPLADYQIVSPSYFSTLDISVVSGRGFDDRDVATSTGVCIVNEAFVRKHLAGRSPIGVRLALRPAIAPQARAVVREIVGVAHQVKGRPDESEDLVQVYVPLAQNPLDDIYLLVAPTSDALHGFAASVREAIARVDTEQLVSVRDVMTLEDVAWGATDRYRFRAVLVLTFAGLALILAMVGMFGIIAYAVQQRVRDIGVRRALGATTPDVLRIVFGSTGRIVAAGGVAGALLAVASSRLLGSMLFGVEPLDAITFASVALVLVLTALIATAAPAWRAARIDPAVALRNE